MGLIEGFTRSDLPTDKAVISVLAHGSETFALCANVLEKDRASPGTLLFRRPEGGTFAQVHHFEDAALRSMAFAGEKLFLVGSAGAAFVGAPGSFRRLPTGTRDTLFKIDGSEAHGLYAVGENAVLHFDGTGFAPLDAEAALGRGSHPTLVDVDVTATGRVWAVGTSVQGACVVAGAGGNFHGVELPPLHFHAVHAPDEGGALALGNDGAWRIQGGKWERVLDLSAAPHRPSGHPAFIYLHRGKILMGSVDPVGGLQSLLGGKELPETNRFHLWFDHVHETVKLDGALAVTFLGVLPGRLVVGATGAVFETPLPSL